MRIDLFSAVFEKHRSIRRYKQANIPQHDLSSIIEAGRRAPTDASLHLWTVIRVVDRNKRRKISDLVGQNHIYQASEFLVFIADLYRLKRLLQHRGEELGDVDFALLLFAAVDAALAAENMAIMAESLGYGTCFIGGIQNIPDKIIELLELPPKTYPLFGLTIGVPDEDPPKRPRLPTNQLVHVNRYRDYTENDLEEAYRVMAPITRSRDWLRVLKRYAGRGGYFEDRNRRIRDILSKQGFSI